MILRPVSLAACVWADQITHAPALPVRIFDQPRSLIYRVDARRERRRGAEQRRPNRLQLGDVLDARDLHQA